MPRFLSPFCLVAAMALAVEAAQPPTGPYDKQVAENLANLAAETAPVRAAGAEALGFLRAYSAQGPLLGRLHDPAVEVRRQAAMALAWCGGRPSVPRLLESLDDQDWVVRQAAYVSLTNLTGMEFPFTSTAATALRNAQAKAWRDWWASVPVDRPPKEVLELLVGYENLAGGRAATASTTYRGPADVLLDGEIGPAYWQTKGVKPPQWCTVDLDRSRRISRVVIHQYSDLFVMNEYELATSLDNKTFDVVKREKVRTPVELVVEFPPRQARYVRITSFGSVNPTYPCTFFEIQINGGERDETNKTATVEFDEPVEWRFERGLRALGALGGQGATETVLDVLGNSPPTASRFRPMVAAGIRSLGRLREEAGFQALVRLLDNTMWARRAADALGDFGDRRAVAPLLAAYPKYAKKLDGSNPADVPRDDVMTFPSEDRMLETPYFISYALCRLPLDDPQNIATLAKLAPLIITNMQGDHDTFMLYQPEVGHLVTRHLMEKSGRRQEACEHVFKQLARPHQAQEPREPAKPPEPLGPEEEAPEWSVFRAYRMSTWLTAVCTDKKDLPRLLALLQHDEGWVRINAAKTIAWLGDKSAVEPIAQILTQTRAEADFGYVGTFKDEEYNDPAPRWREGLIRALGILQAHRHTDLIVRILNDERAVAEIRRAAADALADLGNDTALAALEDASLNHSVYSVRHIARDAVRSHGGRIRPASSDAVSKPPLRLTGPLDSAVKGIVFIKGNNSIPNTLGTVEQADRWRATYAVTDSGPAYRPGRNLYILRPPRAGGKVTPLTAFPDGYVAEQELSWDGTQVVFSRRGQEDPWWQIWRINTDGSGLVQLTQGPYHHVGPVYLPDGRIVCATSHSGIRDEYHGYPCTALCVMNADGSDMRPLATNIGRDNEPSILNDGRIVFSRLEVFYSRNKTELSLHAMHPDGTQDVVLYGPERRQFWRDLDHGPKSPADGQEAPLTHRVLRMTQAQPVADDRGIVVTTQAGLVRVGSQRNTEELITPDYKERSYTTPFPMADGTILCASTLKTDDREKVDLALYSFDPSTAKLELIYNDPAAADFEPRPIMARRPPMTQPVTTTPHAFSGRFVCSSVFNSREEDVRVRGRLVRLIEGVPVIARHSTQTNPWPVWKNHGGTFARVLGTAPVAPDGSFYVEAPADRLLHFQVLDSDRRVINQQLTWIYPRPGETKSCVGCHENPHTTSRGNDPLATHHAPLDFLPTGMEFGYRAKAWFKGHLPAEIEERTRTVRAVNLMGR